MFHLRSVRLWLVATFLCLLSTQTLAASTIPQLWKRSYGSGTFKVLRTLEKNSKFTRYLIQYPSEGLNLRGFVNVPNDSKNHAIVVMLHGYVKPGSYKIPTYTTPYADDLTRAGFIVFHPHYRGHGGSQGQADQDLLHNDDAVDVLNLLAMVRKQTGTGILKHARDNIGLWGYSMGGGIALKVMTVDPRIKAAVLYAPMSGDEKKNLTLMERLLGRGNLRRGISAGALRQSSALNYLENVSTAIRVHHGLSDTVVPFSWSKGLCETGKRLHLSIQCSSYAGASHAFTGKNDLHFRAAVKQFFQQYL